jgi:hypothetical protein
MYLMEELPLVPDVSVVLNYFESHSYLTCCACYNLNSFTSVLMGVCNAKQ